jgi:hypothetical protein
VGSGYGAVVVWLTTFFLSRYVFCSFSDPLLCFGVAVGWVVRLGGGLLRFDGKTSKPQVDSRLQFLHIFLISFLLVFPFSSLLHFV